MTEKLNYISDAELEQLIAGVEQEELVAAPPDLMENILEALGVEEATPRLVPVSSVKSFDSKRKEFYAFCFRVVTSVAAAVALVFLLPELTERMNISSVPGKEIVEKSDLVEMIPVQADVVKTVPDKAEVVAAKPIPSKAEVLDDTGFIEKVVNNTIDWLSKESKEQ